MGKFIDLTGQQFGRWTVIEKVIKEQNGIGYVNVAAQRILKKK